MSRPEGSLFEELAQFGRPSESILQDWIRDILSGRLFMGYVREVATAGNFAAVQLWNPSARHTIMVRGFIASLDTAETGIFWGAGDTAFGTLPPLNTTAADAGIGNMLQTNTSRRRPVSQFRSQVTGAFGTNIDEYHGSARVNSNSPIILTGFPMLYLLGPNRGIALAAGAATSIIRVSFFFKEITTPLAVTG